MFMGSVMLSICSSGCVLYSAGSGVKRVHVVLSALLQLTSDVATGFNQRKPTHRTMCDAVDLMAAFDTITYCFQRLQDHASWGNLLMAVEK